jgi:hypothetical protein
VGAVDSTFLLSATMRRFGTTLAMLANREFEEPPVELVVVNHRRKVRMTFPHWKKSANPVEHVRDPREQFTLSTSAVASFLLVTPRNVRRLNDEHLLNGQRLGIKRWRNSWADVERYVRSQPHGDEKLSYLQRLWSDRDTRKKYKWR